jgi:hypothetical protein
MLDMERISGREKVHKKRGASEKLNELRQARIEAYQERLALLFESVEDVESTPSEGYILVKHDGVFDLVEIGFDSVQCLSRECLDRMPELKAWWEEYFD